MNRLEIVVNQDDVCLMKGALLWRDRDTATGISPNANLQISHRGRLCFVFIKKKTKKG